VSPIYSQAAAGGGVSLLPAWAAAVGFTLQIYFDFSGYTDMALGLARFFGIRLPQNFNSPLKASSIIDFWLRWHMTLTRFLTAYIYNPLLLAITRRRLARGRPAFAGRNATLGAFMELLAFPILLTMLVSGMWHGAGYTFILWGLLHGIYITINHGWRLIGPKLWPDKSGYAQFMNPAGIFLTFIAVAVSMVLFRSPTVGSAGDLLKGIIGANGIALPQALYDHLGPLAGVLHRLHVTPLAPEIWSERNFLLLIGWIAGPLFIALLFPNTLEILAPYEPALGVKRPTDNKGTIGRAIEWSPSLAWAVGMSLIAAIAVSSLEHQSEFLYWQF
jgi:alginate O-acetyltransferase complex protein AlgI